jgi:hypothetical protein
VYRHEDGTWLIELKLRELRQIFHHLDPAPFREKDLDPAAEQYIVEASREIGINRAAKLVVHVPGAEATSEDARSLPEAVAHYFEYRAHQARLELRTLLRLGTVSLVIGLVFLSVCLSLRSVAAGAGDEMFAEGFLVIGWVALWRPVEIFLYDWWPIYRRRRGFLRLAHLPVEVRAAG